LEREVNLMSDMLQLVVTQPGGTQKLLVALNTSHNIQKAIGHF
jgi:hypothetical protein